MREEEKERKRPPEERPPDPQKGREMGTTLNPVHHLHEVGAPKEFLWAMLRIRKGVLGRELSQPGLKEESETTRRQPQTGTITRKMKKPQL